ncbi:MAG: T9SS type A sorting domain-containing protein, partial [Bacteroidetes bacterium]|nr:T9SS type A sorting domain-containing protein [Bacteroidota bacterium]
DRIFIRCDNKLVFNQQWHFRDNMAHLDGISFSSKSGRINDGSTNGEFYLDDIYIEGLGLSTVPDMDIIDQPLVHAYPNPAVSLVRFNDLPTDKGSGSIVLYNMSGQKLTELAVDGTTPSIDLDVRAYSPGMYFYKINFLNYSESAQSLIISH